jgi:hypothetical protein
MTMVYCPTIITEYRNLRENYEYYLRYKEAGQFFIREMELGRKYEQNSSPAGDNKIKKKHLRKRILSFATLYYAVSKYGESTSLPLMIILGTFFLATVYFLWSQEERSVHDSVRRSLEAFFAA